MKNLLASNRSTYRLKKYPGRLVLAAWATIFLLLVLTPSLVSATAYEVSKTRFVYFTPVLIDAHGVIGNNHSYNFQGKWQLITEKFEEEIDYLKNNPDPTATIFHYSGTFLGTAKWDRKTLEVREKVVLIKGQDVYKAKQEYFADRVAVGKCQKDPFLGDGVCLKQSHQWNIPSWNGKSGPIGMGLGGDKFGFLAEKAFDLVEAQQLSQLHHDDPAGAPPSTGTSNRVTSLKKSESSPIQSPATPDEVVSALLPVQPSARNQPYQRQLANGQAATFTVEAERLVRSNRDSANGGTVVTQPMAGFGSGWSENTQLFWSGASPGATLELTVDVQTAGMYAVELFATKAPDYGDMMMSANGQGSGAVVQGYAPSVVVPTPINMGNFNFKSGANTISLTVVGKSPQSSGFFIGVDRIRLHPIDR